MNPQRPLRPRNPMNGDEIYVDGDKIYAVTPEGQVASLTLEALFHHLLAPGLDTGSLILPDGVKAVLGRGRVMIWVHESPPRAYTFKWIAPDSPAAFGAGTAYRNVRLALPYVITLAVFTATSAGRYTLCPRSNECFFRTAPLTRLDDELFYPALLNCSKFTPPDGKPLVWICTQKLDRSFEREPDQNRRLRAGLTALLHCLFHTGFNYSSEVHEGASYYTVSRGVDPRLATVEKWSAASAQDSLFVLEVPWLKTGMTLRQITDRIFSNHRAARAPVLTAADLARLILNQKPPPH